MKCVEYKSATAKNPTTVQNEPSFPIYKITHPDARLTEEQKENFVKWTESLTEKVFEE